MVSSLCEAFQKALPPGIALESVLLHPSCTSVLWPDHHQVHNLECPCYGLCVALWSCARTRGQNTRPEYKATCKHFVTTIETDRPAISMASMDCVYDAAGVAFYANVPERLHITVFHTSQFDDTRPNPLNPLSSDELDTSPAQRMHPTATDLQQEQATVQTIVGQTQPLALEVTAIHHTSLLHVWCQSPERSRHASPMTRSFALNATAVV